MLGEIECAHACMCVSLHTCQVVDHSFPPLALSTTPLSLHTQSTNTGFPSEAGAGLDLLYIGIMGRESFLTQGGQWEGLPATVLMQSWWFLHMEKSLLVRIVAYVEIKNTGHPSKPSEGQILRSHEEETPNKARRASVSSAALRTVLWLTVRSQWPGPTDVLGPSSGSGLDQLREHDT